MIENGIPRAWIKRSDAGDATELFVERIRREEREHGRTPGTVFRVVVELLVDTEEFAEERDLPGGEETFRTVAGDLCNELFLFGAGSPKWGHLAAVRSVDARWLRDSGALP